MELLVSYFLVFPPFYKVLELTLELEPSEADRHGILILLQYHLHKLFVLSIYHPARGHDMGANDITMMEKHELLISARAILRLRDNDTGIWSNWDLVMVTLAALLVLQGFEYRLANQEGMYKLNAMQE